MEYLYIAMFLNEIGKEIEPINIQKVFRALNLEVDEAKIQFLVSALTVLAGANIKGEKKAEEISSVQQLSSLQKRFEALENSIAKIDERVLNEKTIVLESLNNEKGKEACGETASNAAPIISESKGLQLARYVYGVASQGVSERLGSIGLEGAEVYTIPYKDVCAVVHDCIAEPYRSDDNEVVKEWLFTQQEVLDRVVERYGVVLPMSFDMIVEEKEGKDAQQAVKEWLEDNYEDFQHKMEELRDKQEFGIQVILDTEKLSESLFATDMDLNSKRKQIDSKPEGSAYLERELLKELLKGKIEEKADQYFREFYQRIQEYSDDIVIGKAKKVGSNQQMLMNLSCLVRKDKIAKLGLELENIENQEGITVHFSGPWAPYSFVATEKR